MKCPKCKYITFDYLDTCPRCGKDMSAEKAKLNIFSIKPDPPSLLGSLTGDLNDSSVELRVSESIREGGEDMRLKDEEIYDDGSELDINIDEEPISEPGEEAELELGDVASSDDDRELELDFVSDTVQGKEVGEEESGSEQRRGQKGVRKEESKKDLEEAAMDSEDLELKVDLDED